MDRLQFYKETADEILERFQKSTVKEERKMLAKIFEQYFYDIQLIQYDRKERND